MASPFPGMDPYLEQEDAGHDFHERFIPLVATLLGGQLRPRYIVKIDEHIYVHELAARSRRLVGRADISLGRGSRQAARGPAPGVAAGLLEAPVTVRLPGVDRERLSYVEIRDRKDRELVTVVELLSPANKGPGPDREQYLAKRMEVPQRSGPPRRDRPAARRLTDARRGPPQMLVLGPGQPGRAAARRRVLADRDPRALARGPGAGASARSRRSTRPASRAGPDLRRRRLRGLHLRRDAPSAPGEEGRGLGPPVPPRPPS